MSNLNIPVKPARNFVPENINWDEWSEVEPLLEDLANRELSSLDSLKKWLQDRSEMEAVVAENVGRRYIAMTVDTTDDEAAKSYEFFVTQINPKVSPYDDKLNRKLNDCPYKNELTDSGYKIFFRGVASAIEIYRDENNELAAKDAQLGQQYGAVSGKQAITYKGEEITMQKAGTFLKSTEREVRKEVFELVATRRLQDAEEMDKILTEMVEIRTEMGKNADFENYRDYKFKSMGRFDYSVQDCFNFHESIEKEIVPIVKTFTQERMDKLGFGELKPYDLSLIHI